MGIALGISNRRNLIQEISHIGDWRNWEAPIFKSEQGAATTLKAEEQYGEVLLLDPRSRGHWQKLTMAVYAQWEGPRGGDVVTAREATGNRQGETYPSFSPPIFLIVSRETKGQGTLGKVVPRAEPSRAKARDGSETRRSTNSGLRLIGSIEKNCVGQRVTPGGAHCVWPAWVMTGDRCHSTAREWGWKTVCLVPWLLSLLRAWGSCLKEMQKEGSQLHGQ